MQYMYAPVSGLGGIFLDSRYTRIEQATEML